jgi:hypothetical protein
MTTPIEAAALTSVEVDAEGRFVSIGVKATDGARHAVRLAADSVGILIMTLPKAMQMLLRQQMRDPTLRYVFRLGRWHVDEATTPGTRLLTLSTADGFEACFSLSEADADRLAKRLGKRTAKSSAGVLVN